MAVEKACKKCKRITTDKQCPICKGQELTPHWRGKVVIIDPEKSQIAKEIKAEYPGAYALKIR